jgi:methoxymalonate biosynthesis protein
MNERSEPGNQREAFGLLSTLVGDQADGWDLQGRLPESLLRRLGKEGLLCAQVPAEHGGQDLSSRENGELTAHAGSLCSSLRSVMTSQGMAAWILQQWGGREQQATWLPRLAGGELAGVAFSEPAAGSDLSAMRTRLYPEGDTVVVDGEKSWVTAAEYADLLVVVGAVAGGAAVAVVPTSVPGVHREPVPDPLGCRAAGHAHVRLETVRLPADHLVATDVPLGLLVTSALTYGRLSVAWGCVGILRACLAAATRHAETREQFGVKLAEHQLVARHLAELYAAEQVATRVCEHASRCWDDGAVELVPAAVLAKYVSAAGAARGSSAAVQVLGSTGARDGTAVARAYRDAKVMEIIEGSTEISQLLLAEQALAVPW